MSMQNKNGSKMNETLAEMTNICIIRCGTGSGEAFA
jgi:hypothetical protein